MLALDLEQLSTARATCTHQGLPDCRQRREGNQITRSLAVRQDEAFTNSVLHEACTSFCTIRSFTAPRVLVAGASGLIIPRAVEALAHINIIGSL